MADQPALILEELNLKYEDDKTANHAYRSRVPGGWLIFIYPPGKGLHSVTFYPDPNHAWDGGTSGGGS